MLEAIGGERILIGPTITVVKVSGGLTSERFGVVEMHIPAGFAGPPPHVHRTVDHLWHVLGGNLDLLLDGRWRSARAGDLALVPAGTVHSFSTADGGPAVLLEADIGRALDGYFRELREVIGAGPVDPEVVGRVMARHDTTAVVMSSFRVSVHTPVDPATAYRFVADGYAANHPRWDPGIIAVELDGPVRAGARGSEMRRFLGRESTTWFEVLAADPPHRFVLRDSPTVWDLTRTYEIVPHDSGGTELSLDFAMTPRAPAFRLAFPVVGRLIRRQVRSTVEHLGRVLAESNGRAFGT